MNSYIFMCNCWFYSYSEHQYIIKQYLTETVTNTLKTVTDHYRKQKLFLTSQRTHSLAILNAKLTINSSLGYWCRSDTLKLESSKMPATEPSPHPVYPQEPV
jgi:hypothetical protein